MSAQEIVKNNKIIETFVGSNLYGTSTPTSDVDIAGVFMPTLDILLGLTTIEQVDNSIVSKDENGKNNKDAVDQKYYSFHKFVNLAIGGSPNIIERLFIPKDKIIFINEFGQKLLDNRDMFITKRIIPRYLGYAVSQKHKMIIRTDAFLSLVSFNEFLQRFQDRQILVEIKNDKNFEMFGSFKGDVLNIGDLNLNRTIMVKDAKRIITERLSKASNRSELALLHKFDVKFASHLVRLLVECKELLETGNLVFPLKTADHIKDIKSGKFTINEVLEEAQQLEDEIRLLKDKSCLPESEDFKKINDFVVETVKGYNNL